MSELELNQLTSFKKQYKDNIAKIGEKKNIACLDEIEDIFKYIFFLC